MNTKHTITATIQFEKQFWVGIFESQIGDQISVAKHIFGSEPTDPEVFQFVLNHWEMLNFSAPVCLESLYKQLKIKRVNPKRMKREVKKQLAKAEKVNSVSHEAMRLELEKNKLARKTNASIKKQDQKDTKYALKQAQKKERKKGH